MQCVDLGGRRIIKKVQIRLVHVCALRAAARGRGPGVCGFFKQKTAYEM